MGQLERRAIIAIYCFLFACQAASAAQPTIDWVAAYNGPGSYWDSVNDAMVRDGSLYVVGFATFNEIQTRGYVTIKYAPDGSEAWSRIYEGIPGPNQSNEASAVALDASANVYVTGYSMHSTSTDSVFVDAATLKYSPAGDLLWERRFASPGGNVQPTAMTVDPAGFLYLAGATWINGGFDVFLLKYDLDGNLLWSKTHGQPGVRWDSAFSMALDPAGNIILGGYTQLGLLTDVDVYVLSFAPNGSFRWEWTQLGTSDVEQVNDLTVDANGNTYAIAEYAPPGHFNSILTVKLNPSGALVWSDIYFGQSTGDYARGIELSPDGNIYSAGSAWENGSQNALTLIKYTPNGTRLWVRSERGGWFSALTYDLAVDPVGAAYVTGLAFNSSDDFQYLTAKFEGTGNLAWTEAWVSPLGRNDTGYQVRVGTDQRVYVVGNSWQGFHPYFDITSVVYTQNDATGIVAEQGSNAGTMSIRPNPSRDQVTLELSLPCPGDVSLSIYDAAGRLVRQLENGKAGSGTHSLLWDGRSERGVPVAPGVYLVRLESSTGVMTGRVIRVK
jgi:hypothetical protein